MLTLFLQRIFKCTTQCLLMLHNTPTNDSFHVLCFNSWFNLVYSQILSFQNLNGQVLGGCQGLIWLNQVFLSSLIFNLQDSKVKSCATAIFHFCIKTMLKQQDMRRQIIDYSQNTTQLYPVCISHISVFPHCPSYHDILEQYNFLCTAFGSRFKRLGLIKIFSPTI